MTVEGRGAVTCGHAPWTMTLTTPDARVPTVRRSNPGFVFCVSVLLADVGERLTRVQHAFIDHSFTLCRGWWSGYRIPVGVIFLTSPDKLGVHPASYVMCTESLPMVKRSGGGCTHSSHLASRLKKE